MAVMLLRPAMPRCTRKSFNKEHYGCTGGPKSVHTVLPHGGTQPPSGTHGSLRPTPYPRTASALHTLVGLTTWRQRWTSRSLARAKCSGWGEVEQGRKCVGQQASKQGIHSSVVFSVYLYSKHILPFCRRVSKLSTNS